MKTFSIKAWVHPSQIPFISGLDRKRLESEGVWNLEAFFEVRLGNFLFGSLPDRINVWSVFNGDYWLDSWVGSLLEVARILDHGDYAGISDPEGSGHILEFNKCGNEIFLSESKCRTFSSLHTIRPTEAETIQESTLAIDYCVLLEAVVSFANQYLGLVRKINSEVEDIQAFQDLSKKAKKLNECQLNGGQKHSNFFNIEILVPEARSMSNNKLTDIEYGLGQFAKRLDSTNQVSVSNRIKAFLDREMKDFGDLQESLKQLKSDEASHQVTRDIASSFEAQIDRFLKNKFSDC